MPVERDLRQLVRPAICDLRIGRNRDLYYNSVMEKIRFVYLTSPPFSGSTLFSFLANTHRQIATVGEMTGPLARQDPATYKCSCGCRIKECAFWQQVAERMQSMGFPFDSGSFDTRIRLGNSSLARRVLSGPLGNAWLENIRGRMLKLWPRQYRRLQYLVDRNKALATSILRVAGKSVFFDASKNPMTIVHLGNQPDVDLYVVHLVRDVRGASYSKRKNQERTNWRQNVDAWVQSNRNIEIQLRRLPADRWIRIRYEDLCRAPTETINLFFEFCGLEPAGLPHDFGSIEHHIVGNRMRLMERGQVKLDEAWRRALTLDEQACAERRAGWMQARYGYPGMVAADLERGSIG